MEKLFENFIADLEQKNSSLKEEMIYALNPPGKLFRPKLFEAFCNDLNLNFDQSCENFSLFLEVHHCYTLVHDDLPCMDDSPERRGRASVHTKFGEWKAVLTGDALMALSFQLLSKVRIERKYELEQFVYWCLGDRGLLAGQYFDLESGQKQFSFEEIFRIHELKTGRLILLASVAPYFFSSEKDFKKLKKLWKLGVLIGQYFQLADDLDDYKNADDSSLNIFNSDEKRAHSKLKKIEERIKKSYELFPKVSSLIK